MHALGDRLALMIRRTARLPLEYVATSFVDAKRTVVENRVTLSTYQVAEPFGSVSLEGSDVAIRSPMSYGRLTNMRRSPYQSMRAEKITTW